MPRKAREKSKSGLYHIVIRGNNGQDIFSDEQDKREFLQVLELCRNVDGMLLFTWALFHDHAHFILREENISIANMLKHITTKYVRGHNKRHGESGRLLHDRYLSEPIDSEEDLMRCIRYVMTHGERLHAAQDFRDDPCGAWQEYIKQEGSSEKVEVDIIFGLLADDWQEASELFHAFLNLQNSDEFIDTGTERIIFSDERIRGMIAARYGVEDGDLSKIEKERQAEIIRELKAVNGISIRRLARASGLTKFIVEKA